MSEAGTPEEANPPREEEQHDDDDHHPDDDDDDDDDTLAPLATTTTTTQRQRKVSNSPSMPLSDFLGAPSPTHGDNDDDDDDGARLHVEANAASKRVITATSSSAPAADVFNATASAVGVLSAESAEKSALAVGRGTLFSRFRAKQANPEDVAQWLPSLWGGDEDDDDEATADPLSPIDALATPGRIPRLDPLATAEYVLGKGADKTYQLPHEDARDEKEDEDPILTPAPATRASRARSILQIGHVNDLGIYDPGPEFAAITLDKTPKPTKSKTLRKQAEARDAARDILLAIQEQQKRLIAKNRRRRASRVVMMDEKDGL